MADGLVVIVSKKIANPYIVDHSLPILDTPIRLAEEKLCNAEPVLLQKR